MLSVSSAAGSNEGTCELEPQFGTSMATPIVAGAAAMVSQACICVHVLMAVPPPQRGKG